MDEGKLWSLIRNVLSQGGAIQLDRASMSGYEEYSARLDAAAAERVPDFTKLADARIAEMERDNERIDAQWRDELRIYRETENARIAGLEADAARYRWLRKHHVNGPLIVDKYGCAIAYEAADNEVDTTRTKKKKTSE